MDLISSTHLHRSLIFRSDSRVEHARRNSHIAVTPESGRLPQTTHGSFDKIPLWDTYAWNNLLQTHISDGHPHLVFSTYRQMLLRGFRPDRRTLPRVLTASRLSGALSFGRQVHGHAFKFGFWTDSYVISALLQLYGRLDSADKAKCLLLSSPCSGGNEGSSISWTLLAKMYVMEEKPSLALEMFHKMVEVGAQVDSVALATAIGACTMLRSLQEGRNVHTIARRCGLEYDVLVSNSLMTMYIECGKMEDARMLFDHMSIKDVISWTEMIRGYVKSGGYNEGLKLFRKMNVDGIRPDPPSISSVLPACARMTAHKQGKEIHCYLLRTGINMNITVQNAVLDMYVKSGFIDYAGKFFKRMREKDLVSWTVMILGLSLHGFGQEGLALFHEMEKTTGTETDQITYAAVLHACCTSHSLEEGMSYFNCIKAPTVTHYALVVALLARAGQCVKGRAFMEEQKIERHPEVLRALLDGYRIHRQAQTGKRVIEQLCDLEPLNPDNYVLLLNWYADNSKHDMVQTMRETIRDMGLETRKAFSWVELRNKVHVFGTGDVSHPRSEKIYWELQHLFKKMEDDGHKPSSDFSLHDVDEERECIATGHSEMLAISFGLISTQEGTTIRVTKNLRVCRRCHDTAKYLSKIVGREIILKDPNCFHHFKYGSCSCDDFW